MSFLRVFILRLFPSSINKAENIPIASIIGIDLKLSFKKSFKAKPLAELD